MSLGLPRRAQAGVALGLALSFLTLASSPALADRVRGHEWWLRTLHVTSAWRSTQGAGITVALLDTGADAKQADLAGSVITGPDYTQSGRTAGESFWGIHGTAMASLIAGHGHGPGHADGIAGVAPGAKILSVRVTLEGNDPLLANSTIAAGLPGAIARGIRYAVRHHAMVIDLPLDPVTTSGAAGSGGSRAERAAVNYAIARHVVLVAPAGDGGTGTAANYPAAYPGVIAVGAFNETFIKAPYSSHQPYVTVTAAGDGVTAANGAKGYALVHSTSAASAVVAGIVALVKAQFPALTPAQVRQVLTTSTVFGRRGGKNEGSGFGSVDAVAALARAARLVEAVPAAAAAAGSGAAGQAPPTAPAVHSTLVRKNLGHSLITDAGIAAAVFLVLLGCIAGFAAWRRRQARSARLAEVRAAAQVPARNTGKPATARKPAVAGGTAPALTGTPNGNLTWSPDGRVPEFLGRSTPQQVEPVGFVPAPLASGAGLPSFAGAGPASAGPASAGPASAGPASAGSAPAGTAPAGPVPSGVAPVAAAETPAAAGVSAAGAAAMGAPPWAPIQTDPSTRFRGASNTAIPESAFLAAPTGPTAEPADGPEFGTRSPSASADDAGADRPGARRAQGSHRAGPVRPATVSGSPPWDPAPQPDSELPWTQAPAPPRGAHALPQRQPTRPELPTWEAIAEEAWPGGPRAAGPYPPIPTGADSDAAPADRPAGLVSRPADPPAGTRQQADQPRTGWKPGATARPLRAAQPEPVAGFSGIDRPAESAQPPGTTRPGAVLPGAGSGLPGSGLPGSGLPGSGLPGSGLSGSGLPGSGLPGSGLPGSGLPGSGLPGSGLSGPRLSGPGPAGGAASRTMPSGSAAPGSGSARTGPASAGSAGTGSVGASSAGADSAGTDSAATDSAGTAPKTNIPPWEITDSFLAVRSEVPPGTPRGQGSFPIAPADGAGTPRGGASFPAIPAIPADGAGSTRGSSLFTPSQGNSPGFPHRDAEFPTALAAGSSFPGGDSPAESPGLPRLGASFPASPGETPGFPRPATPRPGAGAAPGDSTESFPSVIPGGEGRLPRRIPLSERTGQPPAAAPRGDNAFRLFPPGEKTDTFPAVPPGEDGQD